MTKWLTKWFLLGLGAHFEEIKMLLYWTIYAHDRYECNAHYFLWLCKK